MNRLSVKCKVLIGVDGNNRIISGTSLDTASISLAEDLVFLSKQPKTAIYVVDGPITIGDVYIPAAVKAAKEELLNKLKSKLKVCYGVINISQEALFELDADIFPIRPEVDNDGNILNMDKLSETTKQQLKQKEGSEIKLADPSVVDDLIKRRGISE
jgi:hypothetical protein